MISFKLSSPEQIAAALGMRLRARRLARNLTMEGLSQRSGVPTATLRKFEKTGQIGLVAFVKLSIAVRDEQALEGLLTPADFQTLDEVLSRPKERKRGRIT